MAQVPQFRGGGGVLEGPPGPDGHAEALTATGEVPEVSFLRGAAAKENLPRHQKPVRSYQEAEKV